MKVPVNLTDSGFIYFAQAFSKKHVLYVGCTRQLRTSRLQPGVSRVAKGRRTRCHKKEKLLTNLAPGEGG